MFKSYLRCANKPSNLFPFKPSLSSEEKRLHIRNMVALAKHTRAAKVENHPLVVMQDIEGRRVEICGVDALHLQIVYTFLGIIYRKEDFT